jgi:hypothetical protein
MFSYDCFAVGWSRHHYPKAQATRVANRQKALILIKIPSVMLATDESVVVEDTSLMALVASAELVPREGVPVARPLGVGLDEALRGVVLGALVPLLCGVEGTESLST